MWVGFMYFRLIVSVDDQKSIFIDLNNFKLILKFVENNN